MGLSGVFLAMQSKWVLHGLLGKALVSRGTRKGRLSLRMSRFGFVTSSVLPLSCLRITMHANANLIIYKAKQLAAISDDGLQTTSQKYAASPAPFQTHSRNGQLRPKMRRDEETQAD